MSNIVLSSAVRQNLLSLQSTAQLLSTTQNRLATGRRVNTALDNPTNFFTAQSLDARAGDINSLLDGISNGVQVLQAANTGITSIQRLVDTAQATARQALQTSNAFSTRSTAVSTAIAGATSSNLLGPTTFSNATVQGAVAQNNQTTTGGGLADSNRERFQGQRADADAQGRQDARRQAGPANITGSTTLSGGANTDSLTTSFAANDTITVNGTTLTFVASGATGNQLNVTDTVGDLLSRIDSITGATTASTISGGRVTLSTGTTSDLSITSSNAAAFNSLGFTGGAVTQARTSANALSGLTLTVGATGNGTATNITFGTGSGQVSTLDQLNAALASNNLQASISTAGAISLTTTNDAASSTIGTIGGTAAGSGRAFNGLTATAPVADATSQAQRAALVSAFNNTVVQIDRLAADASFNGVNLLSRDDLRLVFNETGRSTATVAGVDFSSTGLGLSQLTGGTDFLDANNINSTISQLSRATSTLRSQASTFGASLSLVQVRQDFSRNLINVLQTGSANLTLADTNEEAANSQALTTRQQLSVSALGLANQAQQSVLQLLR